MILVFYITLGTTVFGLWEEWSVVDALYFVIVTITTVGYGDVLPLTEQQELSSSLLTRTGISCPLSTWLS